MPWRIPEADLDQVKRQTDLLALVRSRGIELAKHGTKDFIGRCPFTTTGTNPTSSCPRPKGCGTAWRAGRRAT